MTAAAIPEKLRDTLELLDLLDDRMARIDMLIGIADRFTDVPERVATRPFSDEHKVPACESEAYAWAEPLEDGTLKFHFAVENPQGISARAMAVLLDEGLSGAPLERVSNVEGDIIYRVFGDELSMGKSMGLMGMVSMVQNYARKAMAAAGPAMTR